MPFHHRLPLLLIIAAFAASCATQVAPSGGPKDTEAPEIVGTEPEQGALRFEEQRVRIRFSELVTRQSLEQNLHISPFTSPAPVIEWSGKEATLLFAEPLLPDRTYVISIGSSVQDVRESNPMQSSFTLAFSTGDSLDVGSFNGRVFDNTPGQITLLAYRLDERSPDTLDPTTLTPDYTVQTGNDGAFRFTNLAPGTYRVFAIRDKQKNALYDIGADDFSAAQRDITVGPHDSISAGDLRFRLTMEDTTAPYIQSVEALSRSTVEIRFSEPVPERCLDSAHFVITDSVTASQHAFLALYKAREGRTTWIGTASPPLGSATYLFAVDTLFDEAGNAAMPDLRAVRFDGIEESDTNRPAIVSIYPGNKQTDVLRDTAFVVTFDKPMFSEHRITLTDSLSAAVPFFTNWRRTNVLEIRPEVLREAETYRLCLDLSMLKDSLNQRSVADTVFCITFTSDTDERYGSATGTVSDAQGAPVQAIVRIKDSEKKIPERSTRTSATGAFSFEKVPAGKYSLDAFIDDDGNGKYTFGKTKPFAPSERFGVHADTVRVRARWETGKRSITIP